jgi:hypothetical protein
MVRTFAILLILAAGLNAQAPRVEAGVQVSVIDIHAVGEKPVLGGGRATVRFYRPLAAEVEVNRWPIGGAVSNYSATEVLMGVRAGHKFGPFGVYGKLRPGFVTFDVNQYAPGLGKRAALDAGGVLVIYSGWHFALRLDFGDTVIWYGDTLVRRPSGNISIMLGTQHQYQASVGFGVWF